MLIKYNRNNIHALGSFDGKTIHALKPGWNEFPSHIWKLYEKDEEIVGFLKEGAVGPDGKPVKGPAIELMAEKVKVGSKTVVVGKDDKELDIRVLDEKKAVEMARASASSSIV